MPAQPPALNASHGHHDEAPRPMGTYGGLFLQQKEHLDISTIFELSRPCSNSVAFSFWGFSSSSLSIRISLALHLCFLSCLVSLLPRVSTSCGGITAASKPIGVTVILSGSDRNARLLRQALSGNCFQGNFSGTNKSARWLWYTRQKYLPAKQHHKMLLPRPP